VLRQLAAPNADAAHGGNGAAEEGRWQQHPAQRRRSANSF
jgi:hypothetical protein